MALHTNLPIYKVAYDLLSVATDVVRNMPRDYKASIGARIREECVDLVVLIFRANVARDKVPHLDLLLERLQVAELLFRLSRGDLEAFVIERLALRFNPVKTALQPIARGVDFAGQVIKPWRRQIRRGVVATAIARTAAVGELELRQIANSYFGLLRQASASHGDRARLANAVRRRGRSVDRAFTRTTGPTCS